MKKVVLSLALILAGKFANAAVYDCKLTNGDANDPNAVTYTFDTATEDNKFVELGDGSAIGCVLLKAQTPLLTCGLGKDAIFSIFATTDEGASVLSIDTSSNGTKSNLRCFKTK